ncbi:MAG: hypothetical protein IPM21_05670 [Acidobacteria bacterium]|nr:hypothetical protein [Acidobacteriota bacterium]
MKIATLTFFIILTLLPTPLVSQIRLRLPKVGVPKKEDVGKATESQSGSNANRQLVIDDGFTFFDAEPLQEHSAAARRQVGIGWHLTSHLRMFGTVPNRSGFNVVVSKAGKDLTKIRCEGTVYRKAEDQAPRDQRNPGDDYVMTDQYGCADKTKVIKETGKLDVKVYFFNGSTDEEKLLRTFKIDVREATRVRGLATAPVTDVPHYYIQRHAEMPAAILFIRPIVGSKLSPTYYRISGDSYFNSEVDIYFNISTKKQVERLQQAVTRCSVNGTPVNFPGSGENADGSRLRLMRVETGIYTDRLAPEYKGASEYMDEVSFSLYQVRLPMLRRSDSSNNRIGMSDRRGNWECSIRINGETIRTFRWTVGSDGMPVPHPEQANGNVNLNFNGYLIDTEIPAGGSSLDHRLLPLPNDGLFYGVPWTSTEGKASAGKVPTKGEPFHVPSTKAKR